MIVPWPNLLYQDRLRIDRCAAILGLEYEQPVIVVRAVLDRLIEEHQALANPQLGLLDDDAP